METKHYKVVDPFENLNLRIQLIQTKSSTAAISSPESATDQKENVNCLDIKWLQKISSPRDLLSKVIDNLGEKNERFRKQNKEFEDLVIKQFDKNVHIYTVVESGYAMSHKNNGLVNVQSRLPRNIIEQITFASKFSDSKETLESLTECFCSSITDFSFSLFFNERINERRGYYLSNVMIASLRWF